MDYMSTYLARLVGPPLNTIGLTSVTVYMFSLPCSFTLSIPLSMGGERGVVTGIPCNGRPRLTQLVSVMFGFDVPVVLRLGLLGPLNVIRD